jgi:ubiquinone/menaquinone biosynthesis C-methylase UbiE
MDKPMSNFGFKVMTVMFKVRDMFSPRKNVLLEVGIKQGDSVLDYGCGPGGYVLPLKELVGESGIINALDIHPLAVRRVERIAQKQNLTNIHTILSDCKTNLEDDSQDVVLLYDIFHDLEYPENVISELHRVVKTQGILSFSDHHMNEDMILASVQKGNMFKLIKKGKKTYNFKKIPKS